MNLQLSISGKGHITRQIYRQLRERILDGRLRSGERLPSTRELADELAVARKTVTNVYDLLVSEGFLDTRVGSGTYVTGAFSGKPEKDSGSTGPLVVLPQWDKSYELLVRQRSGLPYDFNVGVPDVSRFPFPVWRSFINSSSRLLSRNAEFYADPQGHKALREAIAGYTGFTRAVACAPGSVVVTNGAQQAFALISQVLIRPGAIVAMEHPGYDRARLLFEMYGASIAEIPVDEEGLVVEKLPGSAKLVYVTPSHQFPTGVSMSLARRMALIEWAAKHGAAIIEDDYDTEFRYAARPLDSLQSLDPYGVVLYVGTFSKVLFPGVRIGFVVAPEPVRGALVAARQLTDWHGSLLTEAALARFIQDGHLARHIRKMRRVYAGRRQELISCLESELPDIMKLWPGAAGLHVAVALTRTHSAKAIADSAALEGVGVMPFGENGLALGYGTIETDQIARGIRRLRQVIKR